MSLMRDNALGVYISIPFCRSKCTYCNFASGVYPASEHTRYVARLIEDLRTAGEWAARMGAALRAEFDLELDAEVTVECAPGQIADETLDALVRAGVNRVSLGVQSFIDR